MRGFAKLLMLGTGLLTLVAGDTRGAESEDTAVYELRVYTTAQRKLDALHERFRDHTMALFEKHGMENVGYWVPQDEPLRDNTLISLLRHKSRDAAKASWKGFRNDPEWKEEVERLPALLRSLDQDKDGALTREEARRR